MKMKMKRRKGEKEKEKEEDLFPSVQTFINTHTSKTNQKTFKPEQKQKANIEAVFFLIVKTAKKRLILLLEKGR